MRRARYRITGNTLRSRYGSTLAKAARQGIPFTLTYDQWVNIVSLPCVYSLCPDSTIHTGIDQIVPRAGYTLKNSQPCCEKHNRLKSDLLTHKQALETVRRYAISCGNIHRGRPRISPVVTGEQKANVQRAHARLIVTMPLVLGTGHIKGRSVPEGIM